MHKALATIERATRSDEYIREGISFHDGDISVDLSQPRTVHVRGLNCRTGETKDYLLKVTQFGKLILV
jgi:hypothetical protein